MSEIDLDALYSELSDFAKPAKGDASAPRVQRIIAGFEEIERFVEEFGRIPQHGEDRDIFERIYATRLDRLRFLPECRAILQERDHHGILKPSFSAEPCSTVNEDETPYRAGVSSDIIPSDEELAAELASAGLQSSDIAQLQHVRSRDEIRAAEEIAKRNPCTDFETFRPLFEKVKLDLKTSERQSIKFKDNAEVRIGDLFILDGQMVLVADMGEPFLSDYGRPDRRLRVVYDNGTESDLLVRSLQRALNKDKASRRITEPDLGPLFSEHDEEDDLPSGQIYVLRSMSDNSFVSTNRAVIHKIGVTGGDVKKRIGNAKKEPTYLLADVEIVATFKLANINRKLLEALIHKFFSNARLDLELKDRFGLQVEPREWFLVPLPVIEEFIEKLKAGTIAKYQYDPHSAAIVPVSNSFEL
jgi:hypothetical protein